MLRETLAVLLVSAPFVAAQPSKELSQDAAQAMSQVLGPRETKPAKSPKLELPPGTPDRSNMLLRVTFSVRDRELKASGNFVVESGTQANYVSGGDEPFERQNASGVGVEFKKLSAIVNVLPVVIPDSNLVDCQWQSELSGPLAAKGSLKVQPISNFQLQTEFRAALGKTLVLVDEPDRHVEVKFDEAK